MSAIEKPSETRLMPFALRPLEECDVLQSTEIERDAFPTLFPPTSFRRELKNRAARYIVACRREEGFPIEPSVYATTTEPVGESGPLIRRLIRNARSMFPGRPSVWKPDDQFLTGFIGIWYMVDEAHIVSVGVRSEYRGQGIGELLLIGGIEQAMKRPATMVTLEVRASNHIARNLYVKYGFTERGIRKGYYTDNREDALIMTTDPINVAAFREQFSKLVHGHARRWGYSERLVI